MSDEEPEIVYVDAPLMVMSVQGAEEMDLFEEEENYDGEGDYMIENEQHEERLPPTVASTCTITNQSILDESDTCSICFEPWTASGPHRICCLRCGHLFGKSCVIKWLNSQRPKVGKCPQCNAKACVRDIRVLFCKKIKAVDTTDEERALQDLESERKLRKSIELELSEYKFKLQLASRDSEQLRDELNSLRAVVSSFQSGPIPPVSVFKSSRSNHDKSDSGRFSLLKSMQISAIGQCRVVSSCDYINLLCVSQASTNPLFKGFGVKKIHTGEMRPMKYIHLHSQPIRDLAFHPDQQDAIVASASLDKSLKLTSLLVDQVVQVYQAPAPVWSCCWASPSPHYIFAGCANGSVLLFDIRVVSRPVSSIVISTASSAPVTALQYIPPDPSNPSLQPGGVLAGQLTQVTFLEDCTTPGSGGTIEENVYRHHSLPLEGSLVSLSSLHLKRNLFLASYRPSLRVPRVRHLFMELTSRQEDAVQARSFACTEIFSLFGGTQMRMLSRARIFLQEQSSQTLAVAGDDDAGGALIWNCDTGDRLQTLTIPSSPPSGPVVDVCAFNNGSHLALLSDRHVNIYQWALPPICGLGASENPIVL